MMSRSLLLVFVFCCQLICGQQQVNFNQAILHPGIYNPAFMDIHLDMDVSLLGRRQWMSVPHGSKGLGLFAYKNLNDRNGLAITSVSEAFDNIRYSDFGLNYARRIWLAKTVSLGIGVKGAIQQRLIDNDFIYFSTKVDPTVQQNSAIRTFNFGTGLSLQSDNLDFGVSLPNILNNSYSKAKKGSLLDYNHLYVHAGYKFRPTDIWVVYPSSIVRIVPGSRLSVSADVHALYNQLFWFGGGMRTDKTLAIALGLFADNGFRIVYSYETSSFTEHKLLQSTHEVTISYLRHNKRDKG